MRSRADIIERAAPVCVHIGKGGLTWSRTTVARGPSFFPLNFFYASLWAASPSTTNTAGWKVKLEVGGTGWESEEDEETEPGFVRLKNIGLDLTPIEIRESSQGRVRLRNVMK